jgi:hypothetical protein
MFTFKEEEESEKFQFNCTRILVRPEQLKWTCSGVITGVLYRVSAQVIAGS